MSLIVEVRANTRGVGQNDLDAFLRWWADEHQPEFLRSPGVRKAWLLERVDVDGQIGEQPQRYCALYEVDTVQSFRRALDQGPPWGEWQKYVDDWLVDWTRTYRRVSSKLGSASLQPGDHVSLVGAEVQLATADEHRAFAHWYDGKHIPELLGHSGVLGAMRTVLHRTPDELGTPAFGYWTLYVQSDPSALIRARAERFARSVPAWDGTWAPHVTNWSLSAHRVLSHCTESGES